MIDLEILERRFSGGKNIPKRFLLFTVLA